jgi:uncharacterized membrane protein
MFSGEEIENEEISISGRLLSFLLLGIALVFVGIAVLVIALLVLDGLGSVGGIILIGPIPIIFGSGPDAGWLIVISLILSIASIALFLIMKKQYRRKYL